MSAQETQASESIEHEELRQRLLDTTVDKLKKHGIEELSLRELAGESGTSTQMIYTLFGDKQGLLKALFERGASRLAERCRSVPPQETPVHRLYELGRAYREFALEDRELFSAIFDPNLSDDSIVRRTEVFKMIRSVVKECMDQGYLKTDVDPDEVTDALWAATHGAVSLQLSGYYQDTSAERCFNQLLTSTFEGFQGTIPDSLSV